MKLEIYNLLGERVKTLVYEIKNPGSYKIKFNAAGLASPMYVYRLSSRDFKIAKKLLVPNNIK